jgi:hypothetical protein
LLAVTGVGLLYVLLIAFAIVVLILWVLLPFAVFGVKPLLEQLLAELKTMNDLLRRIDHRDTR